VRRFAATVCLILIALWVGGLWAIGYLAVPLLFKGIPDSMLAGQVAGSMFSALAWVGLATGGGMLGFLAWVQGRSVVRSPLAWILVAMLLLTAVGQFGIQPIMVELKAQAWPLDVMKSAGAESFRRWHGVSSVLYLIQSLLGLVLIARWRREPATN
jgi:hypothetical protein